MSDPTPRPAPDATEPTPSAPSHSRVGAVAAILTAVAEVFLVLGIIVGFNQLATQSPVDAVLPVALFSVGVAGLVSFVAGLVLPRSRSRSDAAPDLGPFDPPSLEQAFTAFALGLVALVAALGHWGVAALAALVGVQGLRMLLSAEVGIVATVRHEPGRPDPRRVGLTTAEAVVLLVFAVAALADGGITPFA